MRLESQLNVSIATRLMVMMASPVSCFRSEVISWYDEYMSLFMKHGLRKAYPLIGNSIHLSGSERERFRGINLIAVAYKKITSSW